MSISTNYPTIKPSLLLDFANTKQLDPRITFTRASTATYYDGVTTAKDGENLLLQSQDFTTTWTTAGTNATITANTTAAPDGTTTADTLTDDATNSIHRVGQTGTTSNTEQAVYSVFAKYSTMQWISISVATALGSWAGAKFDIQNGVLGSISQQGSGWTANSSSITSVGGGWYRCVLVYTPGASGTTTFVINGATNGTTFTTNQRGSEVYIGTGSSAFIWGAQLEQRSVATAYTPTTTQPITNYIPVLLTAAAGVPRFNHNPTTGESLGLLVEEQRTNLLTYSSEFDNAAWTKTRSSITANTVVAPDGTLTGDKLVEDTTASETHTLSVASVSFTSGTSYSLSIYAKAEGRSVRLQFSATSFGANVAYSFDLVAGTATLVTAGTGNSASITNVGNGWYRCTITAQATVTANSTVTLFILSSASTVYTGNGFNGIYVWGAQLEAGAFATSYIPTVAATVMRNADNASMTGTNFSSWYRPDEGAIYVDYQIDYTIVGRAVVNINDAAAATTNSIQVRYSSGGNAQYTITSSGVTQANFLPVGFNAPGKYKRAVAYKVDSFMQAIDGLTPTAEDTSGVVPIVNQILIGADSSFTSILCGSIGKIAFYPARLTNAQLQALTTV